MKHALILITLLALSSVGLAQVSDSIPLQELREVVVEAPKVIRKADMDVYHPSRSAVDNSKNGMQLLRNLMIPSLTVNDVMGSVTASGQSVELRINGRKASVEEVKTLLPESVRRIEWIDNPGLRYNGANYVLNFIVRNPDLGGSLMTGIDQALTDRWGDYRLDAKLNFGRSQWQLGANYKLTADIDTYRDYYERFTYPDGTSLTRSEKPIGGSMDYNFGNARMAYSYIRPDTTVLYASLNFRRNFNMRDRFEGVLSLSNGEEDVVLTDIKGNRGTTPNLSLYLEQHFSRKQTLVVDFSSSFFAGYTYSDYIERVRGVTQPFTDIHTHIRDRNQAYGIETNYIKNWDASRLTAGFSYTANRNRSTYRNLDGRVYHQRQDRAYFFAEYFHRINKVTLTGGIGAQYTDFLFRETRQGNHSWNMRPQFTLTYRPSSSSQFRLNFTSWQSAPSLARTNIAPQQIDGFQWQVGNPDLKTSSSYMLTLRYNFTLPRVNGTFGVRAFTSPDAITPYLYWSDDRLVTSYENSRGLHNLSFWLSPQIDIIPGWLMASGTLQYRAEKMEGTGYRHYNHDWSGDVTGRLTHWGFTMSLTYMRAQRELWGEKISWGEDISIVNLTYNMKAWEFGLGFIMPFGKYDRGAISLNRFNTNELHMRPDARMPVIQVSYNLQWGRQKRGAHKLINADANVQQSSAAGR